MTAIPLLIPLDHTQDIDKAIPDANESLRRERSFMLRVGGNFCSSFRPPSVDEEESKAEDDEEDEERAGFHAQLER